MKPLPLLSFISAAIVLASCNNREASEPTDQPEPLESATPTPDPNAPISIIRQDIEQPERIMEEVPLDPLELTVGFPDGGSDLDPEAIAALEAILAAEQLERGGTITLRGHSDAGGSDAANIRASQARGDAVKDWMVENGLAEDRISVIAFGEQNPVEPNALPNGEPNEAGRAANRRVDIEVSVTEPSAPPIADTQSADEG